MEDWKKNSRKWKGTLLLILLGTLLALLALGIPFLAFLKTSSSVISVSNLMVALGSHCVSVLQAWGWLIAVFWGIYTGGNVSQKIFQKPPPIIPEEGE